jgi:hypothetical protein
MGKDCPAMGKRMGNGLAAAALGLTIRHLDHLPGEGLPLTTQMGDIW